MINPVFDKVLSNEQTYIINRYKETEQELKPLIYLDLRGVGLLADKRWQAIALTHIQQAFMALERSIEDAEFI